MKSINFHLIQQIYFMTPFDYFSIRPKELESLCLYDFAKYFDIIKKKPIRKAEYYERAPNVFLKDKNLT